MRWPASTCTHLGQRGLVGIETRGDSKNMTSFLFVFLLIGCGGGKISSDQEAEYAYLGLDGAVSRSLKLGLQGFNAASSANLDAQSESGDVSGTLTVTGQADQGSSDNKGLRLDLLMVDYADIEDLNDDDDDELLITYDTDPEAMPAIDLQLKDMPDGTLSGTLVGTFFMSGDLEGPADLNLSLEGTTEEDPAQPGYTRRVEGATAVTGTASSGDGVYEVDVVL